MSRKQEGHPMATQQHKDIVRRLFTEANDGQRYEVLDELCQPDVIIHDPLSGEQHGVEAFRGLLAFFRQAFGEQRTDLNLTLAEGDYVAILHTHHARSTGPFLGSPPTGAWVTVPGIELFRFSAGRIAEFWRFDADVSLLAQLGLLPALQPSA
jgi:predicted ester cyclase